MRLKTTTFLIASAVAAMLAAPLQAQNFNFRWDAEQEDPPATSTKWEDPVNWFNETDGTNFNTISPNRIPGDPVVNFNVAVRNGGTVDFDDDTSLALAGAVDAQVLINRFFLGAPGSGSNSGTLNVSGGHLNATQSGAGVNTTLGRGQDGTLNISGGIVEVGQRVFAGSGLNGHGEINLSGGVLNIYRGGNSGIMTPADITTYGRPSLDLGDDDGDGAVDEEGMPIENTTSGILNISGGEFRTRGHVALGKYGMVDIQGSGATSIGIGSQGSLDGAWLQYAGGTLRAGVDAGGITPILIDDVDDDGQGDVRFESGTFLDPYDLGDAVQSVWHTVMEWDGTLVENGLALTADALSEGWEMQVDGNLLQVRLPGPPGFLPGDYNADGVVDAADYTVFRDNEGQDSAVLNGNGSGAPTVGAADYALWANTYGSSLPSATAVPEPGSVLLLLAGVALAGRRRKV